MKLKEIVITAGAVLALGGVALAADGGAVFGAKCAACHGANGEGKAAMKTAPLKDSKADCAATVKSGKEASPVKMPSFDGKLTPDEIAAVCAHIKTLK